MGAFRLVRSRNGIGPPEAPPIAERRLEIRAEAVQQPVWTRLYLAPSYRAARTADAAALEVLDQILGGGATSRLYRELVVNRKVAASVAVDYDPDSLGQTTFSISINPPPDVALDVVEEAVSGQLNVLLRDGVTDDDVAKAKLRLQAEVTYARDSVHTGARVIGQSADHGGARGRRRSLAYAHRGRHGGAGDRRLAAICCATSNR